MGPYIALGVGLLFLVWAVTTYNRLVLLRNRVQNGWSQVEVLLKNRFDLVPNLVETVKGYTQHERQTLLEVMEARNRYGAAQTVPEKAAASGEMSQFLGRLMAVAESYPELRANDSFLYLKQQLSTLEEKIRFARQFYNDIVEKYNTAIMRFPTNLLAGLFGFRPEEFFKIAEAERDVPPVRF